jgi:hypothetical protein
MGGMGDVGHTWASHEPIWALGAGRWALGAGRWALGAASQKDRAEGYLPPQDASPQLLPSVDSQSNSSTCPTHAKSAPCYGIAPACWALPHSRRRRDSEHDVAGDCAVEECCARCGQECSGKMRLEFGLCLCNYYLYCYGNATRLAGCTLRSEIQCAWSCVAGGGGG